MLKPALVPTSAAAVLAAALFVLASACGDDDGDSSDSTASPASSPDASPGGQGTVRDLDLATATDTISLHGAEAEDLMTGTTSVALGDFNADGDTDLLVGAPQADGADRDRPDSGEAYVMFGPITESGGLEDADVVIYGSAAGDGLGYSTLAADINDDGTDDVLVGAPGVTAGFDQRSDQGRVYAFFGGDDFGDEDSLDLAADVFDFTVTGAEGFSRLGHSIAAGDVNGDDTGDLIIGAPFAGRPPGSAPGSERTALGEVYVVLGSDDLEGERNIARDEYDSLISGAIPFGEFASSVAVADINGDGVDDIIAGAHRSSAGDPAREASGAAYVFYGREEFPQRLTAQEGDEDALVLGAERSTLGYPIAAGDFDGDGVSDVAIGAQLESADGVQSGGAIHIFFGGRDLPPRVDLAAETADVRILGRETAELLPSSMTSLDLDGDGADELVIGSMLVAADDARFGSGLIYVTSVERTVETVDVATDAIATILGADSRDRLGNALSAGELDGLASIVALAPLADGNNQVDTGIVYLLRPS